MKTGPDKIPLETEAFLRIRKWYLIAVAAIAVTVIVAQILIQLHLESQLDDSKVINVAGRQRALSQKLTKEVLLLEQSMPGTEQRREQVRTLRRTLGDWQVSHRGLQSGNDSIGLPPETDPDILERFRDIQPRFDALAGAAAYLVRHDTLAADSPEFRWQLDIVLQEEAAFLDRMDAIVNLYDARSRARLQELKYKEYLLLAVSLMILALEVLLIFRPLSLQIRETIANLVRSKAASETHLEEANRHFREKEKTLKELQELNYVLNHAALFANIRNDGQIVTISRKFLELLELSEVPKNVTFPELLTRNPGQQQYLRELFSSRRKVIRTEEIQVESPGGRKLWLEVSIIPFHEPDLKQSILIMCSDITERKRTKAKVEELTRRHYEERMQLRQLRASQVVEGQEEERKRIARDIHDGIGQMLTALKFNIESINPEQVAKTREKIAYLKSLSSDLIKGVRTATFNLTPPELTDHGLVPALQKMATELSKLTGREIEFLNNTEGAIRLESLAETNIYRVTQEAINNAIKYAGDASIRLTINRNGHLLSVVVEDNGKGFDPEELEHTRGQGSEGGMGVIFMKERIRFIGGKLFINSAPGEGTRVTINYNIATDENTD
ncbi:MULTISPECIES: ATP-binding protein [unclassified Robiginitalea]|uniref:sensor histidine kinase n=1 Tax=Robiginitalea TaxID=252306 RepID=UPI00234B16D0|nr:MULTISPECIES: ATP-binding protein [unclassified Robiginitalea]MDC6354868.1 type IV pili methyl-accepting chemotaxis transducer N-terminal domain-containing protein [Robiginitalea sp. PM2]MDC6375134.1 type IV pili methyl-accepting chemotaxis transducer N-terminal domain-containing protein [Robiginitalea sp. SP8]